jgi:ATP-binding cassette, subfamily B, bacterial PglK
LSTLFIFLLLLYVDPLLAVIIVTILTAAYVSIYSVVQRKLKRLGEDRFEANEQRFKITGEAFGGIKDLKILGRESAFFNSFSIHAKQMARTMTTHQTIAQMPRFVMETLAFGGILIIVLYFLMVKGDVGQTLPMLALYAFAGYRLMPALQSIFSSVTTIRFNLAALDALIQNFTRMKESPVNRFKTFCTVLAFS